MTTTSAPDSALRFAWPIASSAARTCSVGSWSAGAATISASGTARSQAVTSSGRSSASRIADVRVGRAQRLGDRAQQGRPARARLGQHQHPLPEGKRREQVDRPGEDVAALAERQPAARRDRGELLELGGPSPGLLAVDGRDANQSAVALAAARGPRGARDLVAGAQLAAPDLGGGDVDVALLGLAVREAEEPVTLGHAVEHAGHVLGLDVLVGRVGARRLVVAARRGAPASPWPRPGRGRGLPCPGRRGSRGGCGSWPGDRPSRLRWRRRRRRPRTRSRSPRSGRRGRAGESAGRRARCARS